MKKILALLIALCINLSLASYAETVMMNVNTKKYHKEYCSMKGAGTSRRTRSSTEPKGARK